MSADQGWKTDTDLHEIDPFSPSQDAAVEAEPLPMWRESYWPLERMHLRLSPVYWGAGVPRGHGEPVLVVPAFLSNDVFMFEMRAWLRRIGYRAYSSRIVLNADCPEETTRMLNLRARSIRERTGHKVRLVGHSLGGVLSLALAQREPELIDRVVLVGSPIRQEAAGAHPVVLGLMDSLRDGKSDLIARHMRPSCGSGHCMCAFTRSFANPLRTDVPVFSIYAPRDGVVAAESCLHDDPSHNDEIDGTHVGLVFNACAYSAVARRLAQAI